MAEPVVKIQGGGQVVGGVPRCLQPAAIALVGFVLRDQKRLGEYGECLFQRLAAVLVGDGWAQGDAAGQRP